MWSCFVWKYCIQTLYLCSSSCIDAADLTRFKVWSLFSSSTSTGFVLLWFFCYFWIQPLKYDFVKELKNKGRKDDVSEVFENDLCTEIIIQDSGTLPWGKYLGVRILFMQRLYSYTTRNKIAWMWRLRATKIKIFARETNSIYYILAGTREFPQVRSLKKIR